MNAVISHMADWLTSTRKGSLCLWALERIAFAIGMFVTLLILFIAENLLFPVVTHWNVTYIHKRGDNYVVGGVLHKARACELLSTTVMAVPKDDKLPRMAIYQVKPSDVLGGNVPTGTSTWGPWEVPIPKLLMEHRENISYLEVIGTHRCHLAWSQESSYGTIDVSKLPE